MRFFYSFTILVFTVLSLEASNVNISNLTYNEGDQTLSFDISVADQFQYQLAASWYSYIRIFAKYKNANGSNYETLYFNQSGHLETGSGYFVKYENTGHYVSDNGVNYYLGISIYPDVGYSPVDSFSVTLSIGDNMNLLNPDIKLFAMEMVRANFLTADQWYIGDGLSSGRWHAGNDTLAPFYYDSFGSFDTVNIGNGPLDLNSTLAGQNLPPYFETKILRAPNYLMRYNITQEQYVDFLNCLSRVQQNSRTLIDLSGTTSSAQFVMTNYTGQVPTRNGISCDTNIGTGPITFFCDLNMNGIPNEIDDGHNLPCNHLSVGDLLAYLDWAGLKPINEIHYEWLCRGENTPVPGEYAWGTTDLNNPGIVLNAGQADERNYNLYINGPNIGPVRRVGIAARDTTNRVQAGASTWGHMDLSGNGAEIVAALYDVSDFVNLIKGDGQLDLFGNHNESNWNVNYTWKGNFYFETMTVSERRSPIPYSSHSFQQVGRGGF